MSLWDKVFGKGTKKDIDSYFAGQQGWVPDAYTGGRPTGQAVQDMGDAFGETMGSYGKQAKQAYNNLTQPINQINDVSNPRNMNQQAIADEQMTQLQPSPQYKDYVQQGGSMGQEQFQARNPVMEYQMNQGQQPVGPNNPSNSGYQQMLQQMESQYGQSPEQMEDIMNRVSYHETGPGSRMDPTTIQGGGGPGRGLFQFESGEKQGGATAMSRMRQYFRGQGQEPPAWTDYDPRQGVDASKLTDEQQRMMFMANTAMGKGKSFKGVNTENIGDWWQKHHYAGPEDKTGIFGESMNAYNVENTATAEEQAFPPY